MYVSKLLDEMGVSYRCINEQQISSLGLVEYNNGKDICTFVESEKYIQEISDNIRMVIINENLLEFLKTQEATYGICIVDNPRITYFRMHNYLAEMGIYQRLKFKTIIGSNCNISEHAIIADKNVVIGNNVTIEEFVVIRENTKIGNNTVVRAGCKLGGEGFEFKNTGTEVFRVKHIGGIVIGDAVEIQYNTCIDKAIYPWDDTVIGDYVKIDNLVYIGHAVKIAPRTMLVANTGIGGRTFIGEDAWIGLGATLRNGIKIGNHARANMGAVVTKNVDNYQAVTGNFAISHEEFIDKLKNKD